MRTRKYCQAINEALIHILSSDHSSFVIGQGAKSPWYVGSTTAGLIKRFGENRVIDTPVSENAITGAAVGAAIAGMRPIVVHPRMDFMMYALDPIINQAANWFYMSGGKLPVPLVIWAIVNRGGEQGAQHSQAIHAMFCHIPGLKVVMPSTPADAKGLMIAAHRDNNPVVFIDDRWLYGTEGPVDESGFEVEIGKAAVRRQGSALTLVSISYMMVEAAHAAEELAAEGIDVELIDLRSAKPWDEKTVMASVMKTGRLVIADGGWKGWGFAAEISARVSEQCLRNLKAPVLRVTLPDSPAPASLTLEKTYYPSGADIVAAARMVLS